MSPQSTQLSLPAGQIIVDGRPLDFAPGDSVLLALLRADIHPTGGGCLCLGGDCPHCLATVDGVAYVRTCQTAAKPGMVIEREHAHGYPALPQADRLTPAVPACNQHCDVVVIGQGPSGRAAVAEAEAAGKSVIALDAGAGEEVIGIYLGPLVVARTAGGMLHLHPHAEIIVATGAAEIQPVAPGSELAGIVTVRAARQLAAAGIEFGRTVVVGAPPPEIAALPDVQVVAGELVRFEGEGRVVAVVVRDAVGQEQRYPCATAAVALGLNPRNALLRMGADLSVRAVGDAAQPAKIPPCPAAGVICPCSGVTVDDLDFIWQQGFHELELVKRTTLAGTGTCQGGVCLPYIRSFLADRGEALQPPFTARPVTRQLTLGEVAAGAFHPPTARTALDGEHRKLGAHMERFGGWWRPWRYTTFAEEYWAVRTAVSLGDVSTLGKLQVAGPDALTLLERLYPTQVATIKPGRARYVLLLNEAGYVLDDGLIGCDSVSENGGGRYMLTFTSGGATTAELWLRDWAEAWALDVRILNQSMALGAINVTGPLAAELLARAGFHEPLSYMQHVDAPVAGVPCRVVRLSFTGELSYELHHAAAESRLLWRRLMALGTKLGVKPHGLEALLRLRLEKGHIIVGQDTDYDATPRRIAHEWAVKLEKGDFVGRQAVLRTNKIPLDRQLVGLEMEGPAPLEGALIYSDDEFAGYVTSSSLSPILGKAVMLGWLHLFDDALPETVTIDGRPARRVATPFYDPDSRRARANPSVQTEARPLPPSPPDFEQGVNGSSLARLAAVRIVATPAALDAAPWPDELLALRTAPDEVLLVGAVKPEDAAACVVDPHAIVIDDSSFVGLWLPTAEAEAILARTCEWALPAERPAFAQGAAAELPIKLWLEAERTLLIVPAPYAVDFAERMQ